MTASIHEVLGELRATSLDQRDKGDKFERLIQAYLKTDPEWAARFTDVWLWMEWPGREGRPDTGIDLVGANRDREDFTAIQCKFYEPGHHVSKADIDSFIAASARSEFSQRIVFDTAAGWGGNAEETMRGVAQRVDIGYLDDAAIDWSQYRWETPEVVIPTGKKALRPHQNRALEDVRAGLKDQDRGKLIMACGTGKTFTSLKIAEDLVGEGGSVLFLVPSIQLMSQSLREWMANSDVDIRPFAVCSDVRVGRKVQTDDADMSTIDLTEPATTDAKTLVARMALGKHAKKRMTVVFSTYQSIDVIVEAQKAGLAEFDLVICDEAHRTTGVTLAGEDESAFVRVHDNAVLKAKKRLYMTATPRIFSDDAKRKATEVDAKAVDMDEHSEWFGPELHRLGFGEAVEADLLADYKVLVLAVDENYVAENFQQAMSESGEIRLDEAAKLIGCWNGLAKNFGSSSESDPTPRNPMRTAVAFAQNIKASKVASGAFPTMADRAIIDLPEDRVPLRVEAQHVDGTMGIHERNAHLAWLKEETTGNVCRILSNAKCLSEGVDIPALDAVLFLTPRGSQVDVVQSVGRVMRIPQQDRGRARADRRKQYGYIILPVVVPSGIAPEEALRDNERYKVVWQVLQALRSHDDRFHALINKLELNKKKPTEILDIIPITNPTDTDQDGSSSGEKSEEQKRQESIQAVLEFPTEQFRDAMYARIVQKVGERRYWETWAKDVAEIAAAHTTRINGLLTDPDSAPAKEFAAFLDGLRGNLNDSITREEAIEMLAQHLVTRPIFEALFDGHDFAATNPVAMTMELMLASLDEHALPSENEKLEKFYASVRSRVEGVDNAEGKQRILVELYDKFFAVAFKRTVDKLGIVYTPIEIVDFILRSADAVLREEFGQGLTDEGVHILDGFTGTGTFLVRLLQSGLIEPHDLARKYAHELHGNEILLLAYYIACVNIEQTYAEFAGTQEPFPGLILTDTFQSWEPDDRSDLDVFPENNARLEHLKSLPITVIIGNPPYSVGQDSANDQNANEDYEHLDQSIRDSYGRLASKPNFNTLQDSYIRAIRWASLRIADRGLVAFVTNGGFITSNSADGMRKTLEGECSSIHVFNLRGNALGVGDKRKREGGGVFGGGSRATVAVTVLVKNPEHTGQAVVRYTDIGDYLTREEKLAKVAASASILDLEARLVPVNDYGDWASERREDFASFISASAKDAGGIFAVHSGGIKTNRDLWAYAFGREAALSKMQRLSDYYNELMDRGVPRTSPEASDEARISWDMSLGNRFDRGLRASVDATSVRRAIYRPFTMEWLLLQPDLLYSTTTTAQTFPTPSVPNLGFVVTGKSSHHDFSVIAVDSPPDLHVLDSGQFFPRWTYANVGDSGMLDLGGESETVDGYRRVDNITDDALMTFSSAYPADEVTKDDIFFYVYGLLHSPAYRLTFESDLKKMLPRIPLVKDFRGFADAGRKLVELHLNYQTTVPYSLEGLDAEPLGDAFEFFAVGSKKMAFGKATSEQKAKGEKYDRSLIHYNDKIALSGFPDDAYRYVLGSRSAIEWIIDRYYTKTDKASGIVNDPNDWSREVGDPRYIIDLLARVVTVSVETMKIVDALPALDILDGA